MSLQENSRSMKLEDYPDVLTPYDTRNILGIGRDKMYEMLQVGTISSLRVGRKYLIPKFALLRYLEIPMYNETANVGLN